MTRDIGAFMEFCNPTEEEKIIRKLVAGFYTDHGDLKDFGITHILCSENAVTIATTRPGYVIGTYGKLINSLQRYLNSYAAEEHGSTEGETPLQKTYDKVNIIEVRPLHFDQPMSEY